MKVKRIAWIALALAAAGCHDGAVGQPTPAGPTPPAPPAVPAPPVGSRYIRIVSGADGAPVRGATVKLEGRTYQSDTDGSVAAEPTPGERELDVTAEGFLPRRTTTGGGQIVSLWPVANDAEADAVRRMVYERGGPNNGVLYPAEPSEPFYVTFYPPVSPGVIDAWRIEAQAFGAMFGLKYELTSTFQYSTNEIAVSFVPVPGESCSPILAWGFCRDPNLWYKIFTVLPEKATAPATIRRVLASWFLGPNPLPGFMNTEAPADELSPLEIQTIRMILQRPLKNRWPDDDRW